MNGHFVFKKDFSLLLNMPNDNSLTIYCIYNANGSLSGELVYFFKKYVLHIVRTAVGMPRVLHGGDGS